MLTAQTYISNIFSISSTVSTAQKKKTMINNFAKNFTLMDPECGRAEGFIDLSWL